MAESHGQEKARWITTIIVSSSLQGHEISTCLQNQQHRVRYSDTVENGSIIFSLSGVAFLLSDAQDLFLSDGELHFDRIKKFMTIHRNGFLLLLAALYGSKEWDVMFRIQQSCTDPYANKEAIRNGYQCNIPTRDMPQDCKNGAYPDEVTGWVNIAFTFEQLKFLGSNIRIIPVHNTTEAVRLMLIIAKTTSKPHLDNIHFRMAMAKMQIVEQSPVWKMLHQIQLDCSLLSTK